MSALLLALALQIIPPGAEGTPPARTAADLCVELRGDGRGMIGDQRFKGRALTRAIIARIPPGRPVFMRFGEGGGNDIEGLAAVSAAAHATNAPEIVIVETCAPVTVEEPQ